MIGIEQCRIDIFTVDIVTGHTSTHHASEEALELALLILSMVIAIPGDDRSSVPLTMEISLTSANAAALR